jgi:hypothetical protein
LFRHPVIVPTQPLATEVSARCHVSQLYVKMIARVGMLSDSYINGYEPSRVLLYAACIGMDVALVSADLLST